MSVLREILADLKASVFPSHGESESPAEPVSETPQVALEPPGPDPVRTGTIATVVADEASQPPPAPDSLPEPASTSLLGQKARKVRWYLVAGGAVTLAAALAVTLFLARLAPLARAPSEEVVATYTLAWGSTERNVQISKTELSDYLTALAAETQTGIPDSIASYRAAVEEMVVDRLLWDGLLGRTGPESMRRLLTNVANDWYPVSNLDKVVATIPIADSEVRAYYDNHPDQFGNRSLSEVREEILAWLKQQRAASFVESYVADLRAMAYVVEHKEVLAVPEVDETAMAAYFQEHRDELAPPHQAQVGVLRFHLREDSRLAAEEARSELEQGQDLATVGLKYASHCTVVPDTVIVEGQWAAEFQVVFGLQPGEISPVIEAGDAYYVVFLKQPIQASVADYENAKEKIRATLWAQAADEWFKTRAESPIFEISNHVYRAGDFYNAFTAQPDDVRAAYNSTQKLHELVKHTIDWLLVVEEAESQGYPPEAQGGIGARLELLAVVTGEPLPDPPAASEEESSRYMKKHPEKFTMPTRFVIRYAAIESGSTTAERSLAWKKVQEAYAELTQLKRPPEEAEFLNIAGRLVDNPDSIELTEWIVAARPEDIKVIDLRDELMAHPLYDALQDLQAGDLVPPIESDGIIFFAQVVERQDRHELEVDDARTYLTDNLGMEQAQSTAQELSKLLLKQVDLAIYDSNLRAMLAGK